MKRKKTTHGLRAKYFSATVFILSFFVMGTLSTIQNMILGSHIDYTSIPTLSKMSIVSFWMILSIAFTLFTRWQIRKNYDDPMRELAQAAQAVAGGDFSVYVRPHHTSEKADYLDVMIEDFNKMVAELGSIETLKTEFFSTVSHEIRTPLSVVQNHAELLTRDSVSEEQRKEYANTIVQSSKKLSALITNILKLNKLEQQKIRPTSEAYHLSAQLSACALQFEEIWEKKNITFEADFEDRIYIEADEDLLEIVWNNLLSNAFKFTDHGGRVTLTQTSTSEEVTVVCSDTGCGMSTDTKKHIFDKFYQGDPSHTTEGNGLGLSLALRVIQLLDGDISVKSQLGEGTKFTVHLPMKIRRTPTEHP